MKKYILMVATALSTTVAFSQNSKDETALRTMVSTIEKGWNQKSGKVFSSVFADTHDYVVVNGLFFAGFTREGNAAAHQNLFDQVYKTTDLKITVDKIKFIRPDLAMIHALAGQFPVGGKAPADPHAIMTILAEKQKDEWKIISFHNHGFNVEEVKQRAPMPVNVMYASWYK